MNTRHAERQSTINRKKNKPPAKNRKENQLLLPSIPSRDPTFQPRMRETEKQVKWHQNKDRREMK
jgi:hypothetical protein